MTDGLKNKYRKAIIGILTTNKQVEKVVLFGSRAMGTFTPASDVDIALFGDNLTLTDQAKLAEAIDELSIPQRVDILLHKFIKNEKLIKHIKRHGVEWYRRSWAMVSDWKAHKLGNLVEINHGFAFKSSNFSDEPTSDILLTPDNFAIGGGFKYDKLKYFDGDFPEEFVLIPGDLLVTMTDLSRQADTLGYPAIVPETPNVRYLHNQRLGLVKIRPDAPLHKRYLFYLLCSKEYRHEVIASATGTTVKHTAPKRIAAFKFLLPTHDEQRAIAHILGSFDDKIELNRQMNRTLEAMAQAIFKSWFVDFDPVRAKAEGRDPGLPKEIADLFPNSFENSELGEIPKGWKVSTIGDILELAYGKALKVTNRRPGTVPVYGSNGRVGWHDEKLAQCPGIVVGRKDNPGIVTWVPTDFFPINTTFYVDPKDSAHSILFLFYALQGQNLPSLGANSAVLGLNRNMAHMNQWVIPPAEIVRAFDDKCFPFYDKIQEYNEE
ncbi:MAG: restriction endonuclease subunit S, partial [Desulfobacterales bacterium]|nr:restriction endonuclease subunit S [Desulfobacterales bacterium]